MTFLLFMHEVCFLCIKKKNYRSKSNNTRTHRNKFDFYNVHNITLQDSLPFTTSVSMKTTCKSVGRRQLPY